MKQRKSPRRQDYDYRAWGTYFITICTKDREHYFGTITDKEMYLSPIGNICHEELYRTLYKRSSIDLHEYIIMPNHVHLLLAIAACRDMGLPCPNDIRTTQAIVPTASMTHITNQSLWSIVWWRKSAVSKCCREQWLFFAWQSRYHDHVVRNKEEYNRIMYYIKTNPSNRENDMYGK